jgi:hypothetical protein
MAPAMAATDITPEQKLVLIMVTDQLGDQAGNAHLLLNPLAAQCCMSKEQLVACIAALVILGKLDIMVSLT